MAQWKVQVTVVAKCTYTRTVTADSEVEAWDAAWETHQAYLPSDFNVNSGYIDGDEVEFEDEQLTWNCEDCEEEFPVETAHKFGLCKTCFAKPEYSDLWGKA
jgi:hypothetical protein